MCPNSSMQSSDVKQFLDANAVTDSECIDIQDSSIVFSCHALLEIMLSMSGQLHSAGQKLSPEA